MNTRDNRESGVADLSQHQDEDEEEVTVATAGDPADPTAPPNPPVVNNPPPPPIGGAGRGQGQPAAAQPGGNNPGGAGRGQGGAGNAAPGQNNQDDDDDDGMARAGEINTIPVYDGERGDSFINWVLTLENAGTAYGWDDAQHFRVAVLKGGTAVQEFLRAKRLQEKVYTSWAAGAAATRAKPAFMERFGPRYTAASSVAAISSLKQKDSESCALFMDRVTLAAERLFHDIPDEDRDNVGFRTTLSKTIMSLFGAGLKTEISKVVFSAARPPVDVSTLLSAAEAVEIEMGRKPTASHPSVFAVKETEDVDRRPEPEEELEEEDPEHYVTQEDFHELCMAVATKINLTKVRCYNCDRYGHFASSCMAPRRPFQRRGTSRRGGFQPRRPTRMMQRRRPFGRSRPTMAVYDDFEAPPDEVAEEEDEDHEDSRPSDSWHYGFLPPAGN